ncbi:MAG: Ig-like domain-containing protein, partial [Myxococcales bacterium]
CVRARDQACNRSAWKASNGITVDTTPPSLVSVTPANGATGVDLRTQVVLTFSEAIDPAGAPLQLLLDGAPHPATVSWNTAGTTATFRPQAPYPHLAVVTVQVGPGLADRAGNATTQAVTRSFTVRDWRWEAPARLQVQSSWGGYTTAATDHAGRVVAIWGEGNNPWRLFSSTYVPGTGWSVATRLAPSATGNTVDPGISIGRNGHGMAVWSQTDGPRNNIYAATWSATAGWGTPTLIESHAGDGYTPRVFVDGAGNAVAGWSVYEGSTVSIWANRYTAGGGWGTAQQLETLSYGNSISGVFGDDAGNAMALWVNSGKVTVARFAPSSGWAAPQVINAGETAFVDRAWGTMSNDGTAIVMYDPRSNLSNDLHVRRFTPAGGWSGPLLVPSATGLDCRNPSLGMDDAGNALVMWTQVDTGLRNLYWRRYSSGSWTAPAKLAEDVSSASVAVAADGTAHAAVSHYQGTEYRISTFRFRPASGWSAPSVLETLPWASGISRLVVGRDGTAALVWMRGHQNWWEEKVYASVFN